MKYWLKLKSWLIINKKLLKVLMLIFGLGVISGVIFLMLVNSSDKKIIIEQIKNFFCSINDNDYTTTILQLKNGLFFAYFLLIFIFFFGFIILLGLFFNIIMIYLKGFLVGFTIGGILLTYKASGIIAAFIYIFFSQLIFIFAIILLCSYSLIFNYNSFLKLKNKKDILNLSFKRFFLILLFCIFLISIATVIQNYVFPLIIKLIIKLYI